MTSTTDVAFWIGFGQLAAVIFVATGVAAAEYVRSARDKSGGDALMLGIAIVASGFITLMALFGVIYQLAWPVAAPAWTLTGCVAYLSIVFCVQIGTTSRRRSRTPSTAESSTAAMPPTERRRTVKVRCGKFSVDVCVSDPTTSPFAASSTDKTAKHGASDRR